MDQPILIGDLGAVGVGEDVVRNKNGRLAEIIEVVANRQAIILSERVIHSAKNLIEVLLVRPDEGNRAGSGLDGEQLQKIRDSRINYTAAGRECVDVRLRRNGGVGGVAQVTETGALKTSEEEGLVANDGAADGPSKLIAFQLVAPLVFRGLLLSSNVNGKRRKKVARVENGIAQKLENIPVKVVRSGLGDDVDHRPGVLSILRAVVAGLNAELLKRIRERKWLVDVGVFIDVVAAVELIADHVLARTIRGDGHRARERLCCALVCSTVGGIHSTGSEQSQLGGIAPV